MRSNFSSEKVDSKLLKEFIDVEECRKEIFHIEIAGESLDMMMR